MKGIALVFTFLIFMVVAIDGNPRTKNYDTENNELSPVYEYAQSLNVPVIIIIVRDKPPAESQAPSEEDDTKTFEAVENFPIKEIARHIRELRDIRDEPELSAGHFMKRRHQRCNILRRVCIIGRQMRRMLNSFTHLHKTNHHNYSPSTER